MTAVDRKKVFNVLRLEHPRDQRAAVNFYRCGRLEFCWSVCRQRSVCGFSHDYS
jgi:hypothetical protein